MEEITFETQRDDSAYVEQRIGVKKIRHLSRGIGNSLKELYGYRCQICGEFIGEKYGSKLIHAHHIEYFTKSFNNNPENILIICPNHHGIIHDCDPMFDCREKMFYYPNGYTEKLAFVTHLDSSLRVLCGNLYSKRFFLCALYLIQFFYPHLLPKNQENIIKRAMKKHHPKLVYYEETSMSNLGNYWC